MNKNESKYFNTAIKMDKALLELLDKKDFEYITIKEICDTAKVNRSTFYLHYENTVDLLKETTEYVIDTFQSYFSVDTQIISQQFKNCNIKDLIFFTPEYLKPYLTFIKENRTIFETSLRHFKTMDFESVHNRLFKYIFNPIFERFSLPEKGRMYIVKFYLTGVTAITLEWLERDCEEEIDEIIRIIINCIMGNFGIGTTDTEEIRKQLKWTPSV